MIAKSGLGGIPNVNKGMKDAWQAALFADSGPATPSIAPLPNSSGCFENFFSIAYEVNVEMTIPPPGRLPKTNFPDTFALEIGRSFSINTPNGPLFAVIKSIEEDSVLVDVNHPMAGKTLIYDVKVMEIMSSDTAGND